jgi:hypothetical protein
MVNGLLHRAPSRMAWVAAVSVALGLAGGIGLKGVFAHGSGHAKSVGGIDAPVTSPNDLLVDSALLCVDARQYVVTDVSATDHRMIAVRRNGQPVSCTGGVTLTVDEALPASEVVAIATPAGSHS